jgi:hypothetical protein
VKPSARKEEVLSDNPIMDTTNRTILVKKGEDTGRLKYGFFIRPITCNESQRPTNHSQNGGRVLHSTYLMDMTLRGTSYVTDNKVEEIYFSRIRLYSDIYKNPQSVARLEYIDGLVELFCIVLLL